MPKFNKEESLLRIGQAERALGKKRDVKLVNNRIFVLNGKDPKQPKAHDLGIKSWGHIDCLTNFGGYYSFFVNNFKDIHLAR